MISAPILYGLVLAGGQSTRMGRPKAELNYHGLPQWQHCEQLLSSHCQQIIFSVSTHWNKIPLSLAGEGRVRVEDGESFGPLTGILQALKTYPNHAFFVMACDLPYFSSEACTELISQRDPAKLATAFCSNDNFVEPLCAIYEPKIYDSLISSLKAGTRCPQKILSQLEIKRISPSNPKWLTNVNAPLLTVTYFALLKEQRGLATETLETTSQTVADLYDFLQTKHHFTLTKSHVKAAINNELSSWDSLLNHGDQVAFLPPFAGG